MLLRKTSSHRNRGAALVEYGLLVGLVAAVAIGAVGALGDQVRAIFLTTVSQLATVGQAETVSVLDPLAPVDPVIPDESTGEPTGPAASTFTINTAANSSHRGYHSLGAGLGTLSAYDGPYVSVDQFTLFNGNTFILRVVGDFVDEFAGHTLSCSDGLSLKFSDATQILYEGSYRTYASWDAGGNPGEYLQVGVPLDCKVSNS
jgi:Flp pilus assembly pilin Flp